MESSCQIIYSAKGTKVGGGYCIKHDTGGSLSLRELLISIQKPKSDAAASITLTNTGSISAAPYHSGSTTATFPGLDVHQMGELGVDKELNEQTTGWVRWSPTPEQLLALEAIYKQGTRTPTTEQIQKIALTLRRLGKIEGKNVYYWFQNRKARERYKRRRQVQNDHGKQTMDMKESGFPKTVFELEQLKRMAIPTGFSHASEGLVSSRHSWSLFKEELQESSRDQEDYANWRPIQPINSSTTTSIELLNLRQGKTSLKPNKRENHDNYVEDETREVQALQLFPCRREDNCYLVNDIEEDKNVPIRVINANFSPNKFFEFLPVKN